MLMYGQEGSEGYQGRIGRGGSKRGGGGGSMRGGRGGSKRGGGGGGSRRDGDGMLCPKPRSAVNGYGGADQHTDNDEDGGSYPDKQCHGGSHPVQIERREEMDMERKDEDLTTKNVRIYVGGLGESVTSDDLCGTFSKMGVEIEAVDIIRTKGRSFAYIDFSHHSRDSLPKLFNTYNGCVWKGGRLRLEKAKEDYLDRMKREWDEDAQLASNTSTANDDVNIYNTEPPEKLKKGIISEKKQLRLFFPRLRKVKSLPFTGTGKHKYSFRRVEVPPLPTYFCDCEEHCGSLYRVGEKQIPVVEDQGGGMNKEEIQLMNSVMYKLFETETVSSAACNDVELTKEEDDSVKEINDLQLDETEGTDNDNDSVMEINDLQLDEAEGTDDDNLIINVVSRGRQTTWPNQDSKINKRKASNDGPTHLPLKKKTRKDEGNNANESVPIVSGGEGSSQAQLKGSAITSGAKNIESQSSTKQFSSTVSWSQKSSWRELVGDRSKSSITISDILPSTSSKKKKDKQHKFNTSLNFSDSENEKSPTHDKKVEDTAEAQPTKMDSASEKGGRYSSKKNKQRKFNASPNFSDSENEKSLVHEYQRDHLDKMVEDTAEAQPTNIDSASEKGGRDENEKSLVHEYQGDHLDKKVEDTAEAQPTNMDSDSEKEGGGGNKNSLMHECQEDQLDEKVEDTAEAQPRNADSASEKGGSQMPEYQRDQVDEKDVDTAEAQPIKSVSASVGRGSTWLHKSSWTQLVASNSSSSFSIRQILPDIAFDKEEPAKPATAITTNSEANRHDDASGSSIPSDGDVQGTAEASQITLTDDNIASAPTANIQDSAMNQSLSRDVADLETFSFKRTDASLKEFAKIKAALSEKRKRTSKKK
ncbi:protein REPRESSOR OF SILENCING 3 isoform X2 [Euphorbia lathyris]|uniref:protein REPRESSOR OF SILENCING 3 isoform X2 n=1 Tax=Euphorbia lathyris TaxID=212925 RepID=UPI0033138E36